MAFFSKSDPVTVAEGALKHVIKQRDTLESLRADADASLSAATLEANRLASSGADADALGRSAASVTAADKLHSLRVVAVTAKDADIVLLRAALETAQDDKTRTDTVIYNHKLKEELNQENAVFMASAARMRAILERAALIAPEAAGYGEFARVAVEQGPESGVLISKLIDSDTAAVSSRQAPAKGKRLVAPVPVPPATKPVRMTLFAMRSIKFVDPDTGKLIVAKQFQDVEMPPTYAKAALNLTIAVRLSDPLRKQHHGTAAGHAEPAHAFDLDAAMMEKPQGPKLVELIRSSNPNPQFVETIGPPKRVSIV
jgi:hypothetical protein